MAKSKQPLNKLDDLNATEYADIICYSCGEPGHHKTNCPKPPACFICKVVTHKVEDCSTRRKLGKTANFIGSATPGLGYFHIYIPDVNEQDVGHKMNVGIVYIEL